MTNHDDPNRRGEWPAVGPTEEDLLIEEQMRERRKEALIALAFLGAGAVFVFVLWLLAGRGWL